MKKLIAWILSMTFVLALVGCSHTKTYQIRITIPAGSTESFVYSDEEISPTSNQIMLSSGEGLGDTQVILKTVKVKEKTAYEPAYLTPGMPVEMKAEKGAWFKIGVSVQNPTDTDIDVYVQVEGVTVRIQEANSDL